MKHSLASVILIVVLSLGIILVGDLNGIVSASTDVTGRIDSDAVWSKAGSPYTFTGNVLVSYGVTLTIEPGVTVNFNGYFLMVNGTLLARGNSGEKIQFTNGKISFTSYSTPWNGQMGTGSIIEYADLETAQISIINASPKISNSIIQSVDLSGSTVFANNVVSQIASVGESPVITGNTFNGGINLNSDANTPTISSNTISGRLAVHYLAVLPTISHNKITGGITVDNGVKSVKIDGNTITGGMSISSTNATVSNNNVNGGISTGSSEISIVNNVIGQTDVGINLTPQGQVSSISATITGNTINARQTGIYVPKSYNAFLMGTVCNAVISGNTIYNCANAGIFVSGAEAQGGYVTVYNNVTILNNQLYSNNYAIQTSGISRIEGNSIFNNYWGISGGGPINNNVVVGNTYGIASGTVENNFVANNKYGIIGYNITRNTIINNEVGIASGFSDAHYNNIYSNTLNVNFTSASDGNATYNWWGTTDATAISQSIRDYDEDFTMGRVNFKPTLTALNPDAPSPNTEIPTVDLTTPIPTTQPTTDTQATATPSVPEYTRQTLLIFAVLMAAMLAAAVVIRKKAK